jgi:ABC-type glycerol-3-phosphate transport system substrate-binding protein
MTSRLQIILFIGIGVLALIVGLVIFGIGRQPAEPAPVTLEFWGLDDDEEVWREIITKFQKKNLNFTINYTRLPESTYEEILVNRLAEGRGPDLFMLSNSSISKHRDKIFPLPKGFGISAKDFGRTFADIAYQDLVGNNGEIYGAPLFIDTLALLYNRDIFNTAGIAEPPRDWDAVKSLAQSLTRVNVAKDVVRGGIALGTARNVEHAFEIVSALILQNGDPIVGREDRVEIGLGIKAQDALRLYTSFANPRQSNFSWTERMKDSITALGEGSVAMIIGFSRDLPVIAAKSPHLALGVSPLPQPKGSNTSLTYGSYFFPAVSKASRNPTAAWRFALDIAYGEGVTLYLNKTGRPPARRDLISAGTKSPQLDVYYRQALSAKSWLVPDESKARNIFREAIGALNTGAVSPEQATARLEQQLRLLLP